MRFPAKPLVVGTPQLPLPSDIAASLVVEWHADTPRDGTEWACVDGIDVWVDEAGCWEVHRGNHSLKRGSAAPALAKRAAVLALATHLHEQARCAVDVLGGAAGAEAQAERDEEWRYEQAQQEHAEKSFAPRPFKVGDRVRVIKTPSESFVANGSTATVVDFFDGSSKGWVQLDVDGYSVPKNVRPDEIEHAEQPAVPAFESLVWSEPIEYDECLPARFATLPDGRVARDNGVSLAVYRDMAQAVTAIGGHCVSDTGTREQRASALVAWLGLRR